MALRFEHSFVVKAPPDRVWSYLTDPYRVAPALPGASITEKVDERTYGGGITVKVGPVSAKYKGTVRFESLDPGTRTAEIVARGQDTSGRGGADMRMTSRIAEHGPGQSEVSVVSEVNVTGIMAQFGRGLMQDVSDQMLQKFTESMRAELEMSSPSASPPGGPATAVTTNAPASAPAAAPASAPPVEVLSFGSKLLLRQPAFWIVIAALVFLGLLWTWID
jgi:carbon monoxide dehydrogenase subunit G